jgi:hypothetical protein
LGKKSSIYRFSKILLAAMIVLWAPGSCCIAVENETMKAGHQPLAEYAGNLPFATIADLARRVNSNRRIWAAAYPPPLRWLDWLAPTINHAA